MQFIKRDKNSLPNLPLWQFIGIPGNGGQQPCGIRHRWARSGAVSWDEADDNLSPYCLTVVCIIALQLQSLNWKETKTGISKECGSGF